MLSDYGNARPWADNMIGKINLYGLHRCHVSVISWHELRFGLGTLGGQRRARLDAFYATFRLAAFDRAAALASAQVRLDLGSKSIDLADAMIAGQAISGNYILVSNNAKHFARVKGLHWVNWAV